MEKRELGRTGESLSIVGFGGIIVKDEAPAFAAKVVERAIEERGINYFDVAPNYGSEGPESRTDLSEYPIATRP